MDPTFLIDKDSWAQSLVQKSIKYRRIKEKYILTFFLAPDDTYKSLNEKLAAKLKLPVWSIQSIAVKRIESDKIILGCYCGGFPCTNCKLQKLWLRILFMEQHCLLIWKETL